MSDPEHGTPLCSGHTTTAFFVLGAFLVIFLPLAHEAWHQGRADGANKPSFDYRLASAVWLGLGLAVACCRVLGDAHWLTDTLGGAFLGTGLASAALLASRSVEDLILGTAKDPASD